MLDASKALGRYGLSSVPQDHMLPYFDLERAIKEGRRAAKRHKDFLCPQDLVKFGPQWMEAKDKPKRLLDMTHAQWVAFWWSRTLTQLTSQASTDNVTVTFDVLITEFLNINRMAIEDTCKVAWTYEEELWGSLAEKCLRKDPKAKPAEHLTAVDENMRTRARARVAGALKQKDQKEHVYKPNQAYTPQGSQWSSNPKSYGGRWENAESSSAYGRKW